MNNNVNEVAGLKVVENAESTDAQLHPARSPAKPPSHGRGWPQETVPYPISRAMEFCLENCQLAQCNKEPTEIADSNQQKCRFPQHCSIVPRAD